MEETPKGELVIVPWRELPPETIGALIESFVLREGTNYGMEESLFETKVAQVKRQLEEESIFLVFDTVEDSCTLLTKGDLKKVRRAYSPNPDSQ